MALSLSTSTSSARILQFSPSYQKERFFVGHPKSIDMVMPRSSLPRSTLVFARHRNRNSGVASSSSKKKKKSMSREDNDDDLGDDPFEALFSLLEEDLKNDKSTTDDNDEDDEFDEEDIDELARQLAEALGDVDTETINAASDGVNVNSDEEDQDEDEEEEREVKLKNWQLRRLAYALKSGRRKVSIKNLAAELCLDRAIVLDILCDPPPNILMMSAAIPDEPPPTVSVPEVKPTEAFMEETAVDTVEPDADVKEPVHLRQQRWFAQKRLKKAHLKTLEMVYRKTKRPTDTMISSIVHLTNLPRKRVVKWFEDKRDESGVPGHRSPYRRSNPDTVSPL